MDVNIYNDTYGNLQVKTFYRVYTSSMTQSRGKVLVNSMQDMSNNAITYYLSPDYGVLGNGYNDI